MSSPYNIKLQKVEDAIISECKELITEKFYGAYFDMWLRIDASCVIPQIYRTEFKNEFEPYINDIVSETIASDGSNLVYHIDTITTVQPNISLNTLLQYVETFIKAQVEGFTNECDHIQMAIYDETHNSDGESIEPTGPTAEDNPSSS